MEALKKNKILLSIFVITLIAFIWYFFFAGSSAPSVDVLSTDASSTDTVAGQDILSVLQKVGEIKIDNTLFSGAVWASLHDLSATVPTDAPGRTDLFGPLGQTGSAATAISGKTTGVTKSH